MALSSDGELLVLNNLLTGRFISLHTGTPPSSEVGTAGTAYSRQPITFHTLSGPDPTIFANSGIIQYPVATADWGNVTHFAVWSAQTGGTIYAYAMVSVAKTITTGDIARWDPDTLTVSTD